VGQSVEDKARKGISARRPGIFIIHPEKLGPVTSRRGRRLELKRWHIEMAPFTLTELR
jgi:hypothetical protein